MAPSGWSANRKTEARFTSPLSLLSRPVLLSVRHHLYSSRCLNTSRVPGLKALKYCDRLPIGRLYQQYQLPKLGAGVGEEFPYEENRVVSACRGIDLYGRNVQK